MYRFAKTSSADCCQHIKTLLLLWLCCCSAMVLANSAIDPLIEQQLDHYKQLRSDNKEAEAVATLDTIVAQLPHISAISTRVRTQTYQILDYVLYKDPKQALQQARQLFKEAESSEQADAISEALVTLLWVQMYRPEEGRFIPPLAQSLMMTEVAKLEQSLVNSRDPRILYLSHDTLGYIYSSQSDYEVALEHLVTAYDVTLATDNYKTVARLVSLSDRICVLHMKLKNWDAAYSLINKAIALAVKHELKHEVSRLYLLKGYIEGELQQPEQELLSLQQGLQWAELMQENEIALTIRNNIGNVYRQNKQYKLAEDIYNAALKEALRLGDNYNTQLLQMNLGELLVEQGKHQQGIDLIKQGLLYFRQIADKAQLQRLLGEVAESYGLAQRYKQQAEFLLEQRSLREEVFQAERDKRMTELRQQFETREEEQQHRLLEQENLNKARLLENKQLQQNLTILFAITMSLMSLLLWQLYRKLRLRSHSLHKDNQQLQHQSLHDPLTGLLNRRALMQHLNTARSPSQCLQKGGIRLPDVFVLMDIDHFKQLNDQYGHATGDAVLIEVGRRLTHICRGSDLLVRWGGEEFLLYLPQTDIAFIPLLAQRLLNAISAKPINIGKQQLHVSLTGGVARSCYTASKSAEPVKWEDLLQLADAALYYGKQQGRNRICCVEQLSIPLNQALVQLAEDPQSAIEAQWISLLTVCGPTS